MTIGKVHVEQAVDDVVTPEDAIKRDLTIAQCNTLMLLASSSFIEKIHAGGEQAARIRRDIELATRHGHKILVLLERGQTFPPGLLPESAIFVESDLKQESLRADMERVKEALGG